MASRGTKRKEDAGESKESDRPLKKTTPKERLIVHMRSYKGSPQVAASFAPDTPVTKVLDRVQDAMESTTWPKDEWYFVNDDLEIFYPVPKGWVGVQDISVRGGTIHPDGSTTVDASDDDEKMPPETPKLVDTEKQRRKTKVAGSSVKKATTSSMQTVWKVQGITQGYGALRGGAKRQWSAWITQNSNSN